MSVTLFLATLGPSELGGLISDTTFFGKLILLILLVISVISWAVMVDKARALSAIRRGHIEFWRRCNAWLDEQADYHEFFQWCQQNTYLPLSNVILEVSGMNSVSSIRRAAERVAYQEIERLEKNLILLSTAVTIAPFLGLLGTVWGIMTSFWDMASMRSANLTVVAPGIADALITTIAGLATAIPAVIFYNMLVRKIDLVANEIERLRTMIEQQVGHAGGSRSRNGRPGEVRRPPVHQKGRI